MLIDFILLDQLMALLSLDVHINVKEQVTSSSKVLCLAENCFLVHPAPDRGKRTVATKSMVCDQLDFKRDFSKI